MKKKHVGLIISDIHVGVTNRIYDELYKIFIKTIDNTPDLDFIIIAGDLYDRKIYLNDDAAYYTDKIIDLICLRCKERHIKFRIIYGTESHESDQYKMFDKYISQVDFRVIKTVTDEYLFDDMHVLYVPEEFMIDKEEFYKDYFTNKKEYDFVFGHGVIQEVMTSAVKHTDTKVKRLRVPYFTTAELRKICRGKVFFGHYHVMTNIDDTIFYCGSFSRWCFGEEEPKGFFKVKYHDGKTTDVEFIENYLVWKYKTFSYGYNDEIFKDEYSLLRAMASVDGLLKDNIYHKLRLIFNIPVDFENPEYFINIIKERFNFNDKVKVEFNNGYIEQKKKINKTNIREKLDKYQLIFDKSVPIENKVSFFIEETNNVLIPPEEISVYLYNPKLIETILEEE